MSRSRLTLQFPDRIMLFEFTFVLITESNLELDRQFQKISNIIDPFSLSCALSVEVLRLYHPLQNLDSLFRDQ